ECQLAFAHGDVRINSARARVHPRYWHVACVSTPLGTADRLERLRDITVEQQQVVAPFLNMPTPAAPAAVPPAPADRGSALVPEAAAAAADTADDAEEHANLAGLQQLRNLEWWSGSSAEALGCLYNSTEALLLNQAATLQDVPSSLKLAVGETREASAQAVLDATTEKGKLGAWRCVLAFDRMIFGELFEEGEVQSRSVAETRTQYDLGGVPDPVADARLREDVQAYLTNKWTKTPRGAGAGVQGDRFEHWQPLAHLETRGSATAASLSLLLGGAVPAGALDVALAGKLLGTAKKDGGTRVLACGAIARRMVARAVCTVRSDSIQRAVSELQYGVGVLCGLETLHKAVLRGVRERCLELEGLVVQWYGRATVHSAAGASGVYHLVEQQEVLDQGCPLRPALFSIGFGFAPELCALRDFLRTLGPRCKVWAYLDDAHLTVPKAHLHQALKAASALFADLGLELNTSKTKIWCPDGQVAALPDGTGAWVVDAL
ncbi:unnamed protein product, partial [Prorocentrum cordatum]